jgi:hypothetical protein
MPPAAVTTTLTGLVGQACPEPFDKLRTGSVEAAWSAACAPVYPKVAAIKLNVDKARLSEAEDIKRLLQASTII